MSQYSQMMGSFIRTGNYPMEANYIFPTPEALKEFYSDPINATTLHKGLLRIVENDGTGNQGLYWVTKKQTNDDEFEFTKLISGSDINSILEQLNNFETKLDDKIKEITDYETVIWGTNDPTNVPDDLNSLLDLANAIIQLKSEFTNIDDKINNSSKEIQALAGTQDSDVIEYLKTLPYNSLTEVSNALNNFLNTVDSNSNQINTLQELKSFLEGYTDSDKLKNVLIDFQSEILGNPTPSEDFRTLRGIEDFIRILKADSINTDFNLQSELNQIEIGVGLSGDGSYNSDKTTHYLQDATSVMNSLKILDSLVYQAISGITITPDNNDVVNLNIRKELDSYIIGAKLQLSNALGNDLLKKDDGLYFNIKSTYSNGILSLYANNKLINQHILGLSSVVESAEYVPESESINMVFKLIDGTSQPITIPVGTLIREWDVDNSQPDKVVELERNVVLDGQDQLSADVRIYIDKHNILKKVGNALSVDGTTDSITHNDQTLSVVIDNINNTDNELNKQISEIKNLIGNSDTSINDQISDLKEKLNSEISRASESEKSLSEAIDTKIENVQLNKIDDLTYALLVDNVNIGQIEIPTDKYLKNVELNNSDLIFTFYDDSVTTINLSNILSDLSQRVINLETYKASIDSPTFTGTPQIETSPDADDSSQRIPSTSWVQNRISEAVNGIPNGEFYTKKEIDDLLEAINNTLLNKADLVNGIVPESQLPNLYISEIE